MSEPVLSVVVPVRDGARFLSAALESVAGRSEIAEVVVVDDGSIDESAAIAEARPGVRVLRQDARGVSAARNAGIRAAVGDLIGFLDADDLWPGPFAAGDRRLARLLVDRDLDAVIGTLQLFRDRQEGDRLERELGPSLRSASFPAGIFRRRAFETVGALDESLAGGEDVEWFARAERRGARIEWIDEVGCLYRRHEANATRSSSAWRGNLVAGLARAIRGRRREEGEA